MIARMWIAVLVLCLWTLLLCTPPPSHGADITGWPASGVVTINGVDCPYVFVINGTGAAPGYYQVAIPTQTMGPIPWTVGVPDGTAAADVEQYVEDRTNLSLGGYPIPLPF
jgi:hypothetical protein